MAVNNWITPTMGYGTDPSMYQPQMAQQNTVRPMLQSPQNMGPVSNLSGMSTVDMGANSPSQGNVYYIPGRSVNDESEIDVSEVLISSPINLYPKNDRTEIYAKYYNRQGVIETDVYRKVDKNQDETAQNVEPTNSAIAADLGKVWNRLYRMEKNINKIAAAISGKGRKDGGNNG